MSFNSKLLVPAALGFSLVTVTAFVVYYIFKKDDEGDDNKGIRSSKVNVIEVSVPKSIVPALIGRNGSNIKEIERKTGALTHFKKFSDKDYDVCIIRGRSDATQLAETLIHDFIKQQPLIVNDTMYVPGWACGRIIGTGGENINEISHRSGARVKIEGLPSADKTSQRQISFKGTKEQIDQAKKLIENHVAQEKCRREIEASKRSPRHVPSPSQSPAPSSAPSNPPTNGTPADQLAVTSPADPEEHPDASSSIEVYVSAVSSPSRFWVQFVGPQVAQLDELVQHMTDYYSNRNNRDAHKLRHVHVGQVVAAVFRHDGRWYRARVHDLRANEFDASHQVADVFFVDYGDSEYVGTHELCELRADLLRLRFQAMECFLAGVKPATTDETRPDKWHPQAIERFEELTQVARWKPLVSRTCTYKKTATIEGEKEKEIPGIKLFDVTDEGELDVGGALVAEGWAEAAPPSPRAAPFGDLGNSKVLSMSDGARSSSLPKDHKDDKPADSQNDIFQENDRNASKSLTGGLDSADQLLSVSNLGLSQHNGDHADPADHGDHDHFLHAERLHADTESTETLVPTLAKTDRDEFKANMNRIDSHHSNLEALGKTQH